MFNQALRSGASNCGVPVRIGKAKQSTISTTSPMKTFHRRKLPDSLIALSSPKGRQLFKEALETNTMESYFPLSEQFITQSEPSYCSLSSLAMVLNALNHDPKRTWKGVWRWVTEETLQCEKNNLLCKHSLEKLQTEGMFLPICNSATSVLASTNELYSASSYCSVQYHTPLKSIIN
jgi:hypothetical protein